MSMPANRLLNRGPRSTDPGAASRTKPNPSGFTLVEIAIVLVIVGLLVGFGTQLGTSLSTRSKRIESKEAAKAAAAAVIGHAASYQSIPIWGDDAPDGTVNEFCEVVTNRKDATSKPLYYIYEPSLTTFETVCNRKTTDLTVCRNVGCTDRVPNIAFAVVSGGTNFNPQTGIVTVGCPAGDTCIGVYAVESASNDDCTAAGDCPNYPGGVDRLSRSEPYDDLVEWVTLNELRTQVGCQGPPLQIVNNELPFGYENATPNSYQATVFASGGIVFSGGGGDYKWCLKGTLPNGVANPTPGCASTPDCSSMGGEGEWFQADSLTLVGAPTVSPQARGNYLVRVLVRDNNDNDAGVNDDSCDERKFVITINP
jgi:prepilin-type N-terminal cleavage/methylation domain-containing protein